MGAVTLDKLAEDDLKTREERGAPAKRAIGPPPKMVFGSPPQQTVANTLLGIPVVRQARKSWITLMRDKNHSTPYVTRLAIVYYVYFREIARSSKISLNQRYVRTLRSGVIKRDEF